MFLIVIVHMPLLLRQLLKVSKDLRWEKWKWAWFAVLLEILAILFDENDSCAVLYDKYDLFSKSLNLMWLPWEHKE